MKGTTTKIKYHEHMRSPATAFKAGFKSKDDGKVDEYIWQASGRGAYIFSIAAALTVLFFAHQNIHLGHTWKAVGEAAIALYFFYRAHYVWHERQ